MSFDVAAIIANLKLQKPPATINRFILTQQQAQRTKGIQETQGTQEVEVNSPAVVPVDKDVAFVFFLSWLRERGVSFADIDLASEPTILTADLHPVVAKYVLFIRSADFQTELQKFKNLMTASYPVPTATSATANEEEEEKKERGDCGQKDPSTILQRAKLPPQPSQPDYYQDPQLTLEATKLAKWGSKFNWPLNELLQWGQTQLEDQAACRLSDEYLNEVLTTAIQLAAQKESARDPSQLIKLYSKCRIPTMQILMQFFGFRIYPLEPRVIMFARFMEYMTPFADVSEESAVFGDEDWDVKATELNEQLTKAYFTSTMKGTVASTWIRMRKMKACEKTRTTGCPKEDVVFDSSVLRLVKSLQPPTPAPAAAPAPTPVVLAAGVGGAGGAGGVAVAPAPVPAPAGAPVVAAVAAAPAAPAVAAPPAAAPASAPATTTNPEFRNFTFKMANLTRYRLHPKQEALDEALEMGMLIPLKLGKVPEPIMRNFAAAFMLGGAPMSKEPLNAVKGRCVKFLERFVCSRRFLRTWALTRGHQPGDASDATLYKLYVMHQACEHAGAGNGCELANIFQAAQNAPTEGFQPQTKIVQNGLLLQIPNSGAWMRIENSGSESIFLIKQCTGNPNTAPEPHEFKITATLSNTTLEQVLNTMKANRYVIRL